MSYSTDLETIPKTDPPQSMELKFWTLKTKRTTDKEGNSITEAAGFNIDKLKFLNVLYYLGFRRYDHQGQAIFVQIINHRIIKKVSETNIADTFFNYLRDTYTDDNMPEGVSVDDLENCILNQLQRLFSRDFLYRLISRDEIIFSRDTQKSKFLYFKNCFVEVTKNGFKHKDYKHLEGHIWETELIQREFKPADSKPSYYSQFINKVCADDEMRINSLKSIVGYCLHDYHQDKARGIIFTDSKISADDEPNGRTGKTLFCKALGMILCPDPDNTVNTTFCELNGKDFDPRNKNKYQTANIDTKLIVLNDVRRHFDIEILFNDVTEGVTVEKKNQHPFRIKVKFIVTTNKTIKVEGESAKDRFIEFEFSDYFNKSRSPKDVFNHWFFRDWDAKEWNRFDCFMIECIQVYFLSGLQEAKSINLNERKLQEQTSPEFLEWINQAFVQKQISDNIKDIETISIKQWHEDFISVYPDFTKIQQAKFSRWVTYWTRYGTDNLTVETKFKGKDSGRIFIFKMR